MSDVSKRTMRFLLSAKYCSSIRGLLHQNRPTVSSTLTYHPPLFRGARDFKEIHSSSCSAGICDSFLHFCFPPKHVQQQNTRLPWSRGGHMRQRQFDVASGLTNHINIGNDWLRNTELQNRQKQTIRLNSCHQQFLFRDNLPNRIRNHSLQLMRYICIPGNIGKWKQSFRNLSSETSNSDSKPHLKSSSSEHAQLKENIFTIPNALCLTRILLSPVLAVLVLQQSYNLALGAFIFAGFTDLLDGQIARRYPSQKTMLGSFLDPLADKLLVSMLFLSLTYQHIIPVPLTLLVIARDIGLIGGAATVRFISLPPPKTILRYFDMKMPTAQVKPTFISKVVFVLGLGVSNGVNTACQLALVAVSLAAPVFHYSDHVFLQGMWYLTGGTTVASGLGYIFSKDTVEYLRDSKTKKSVPKSEE